MDFNFISPKNIYFGSGKIEILPEIINPSVTKIFLVLSKSAICNDAVSRILDELKNRYDVKIFDKVKGEPDLELIEECTSMVKAQKSDLIISIGGGSVIDTAKAAAGFSVNSGKLTDYIEGVGTGKALVNTPIEHIAVPTTSGTGAEMTKNAVIKGKGQKFKRSFRHDKLIPSSVIIDPMLTVSVPKTTTSYSGMDAITQLIESYISKKSNVLTDALALDGLSGAGQALIDTYSNGQDTKARERMAYASAISGLCLANSGLGAVHGIAAGLGAVTSIPHGLACAILLKKVIKLNAPHIPQKSAALCKALTGTCAYEHGKDTQAIIEYITSLSEKLNIPEDFSQFNITPEDKKEILKKVSSSSMSGNPYEMTKREIKSLII